MWGGTDSQEVGLEAAILERVRNSSLVECPRADNGSGLKPRTETVEGPRKTDGVRRGERSSRSTRHAVLGRGRAAFGRGEGRPGRAPGAFRSANDGMVRDKAREKP